MSNCLGSPQDVERERGKGRRRGKKGRGRKREIEGQGEIIHYFTHISTLYEVLTYEQPGFLPLKVEVWLSAGDLVPVWLGAESQACSTLLAN